MKPTVDVFVFLYNGKDYIDKIEADLKSQVVSFPISLTYILTDTKDGSQEKLDAIHAKYQVIKKEEFSHSLTREKVLFGSQAEIAVVLTQDCRLVNPDCLEKLVCCIHDDIRYAYLRQVNSNHTIERYTRRINYPKKTIIKDKSSIPSLGINTFFASDACAAFDVSYFKKVNGFDNKDLPTNEDMYYAYKVIMADQKVEYCADSYVDHSHKFKLKQIRERYRLFGMFFKENPQFDQYHATGGALRLAFKTIGMILLEFNIPALFMFLPNMMARYLGKKDGEKSK
jgi:rhamnosyltransferase